MPRNVPSLDTAPRDSLRYLLSAALVIAALYVGSEIFVPVALAILLSFVLAPGVRLLRRCHLGRVLPVLMMTALAFLLIVGFGALLAAQLRDLADAVPRDQSTVVSKIETLRGMMSGEGLSRFSGFASSLAEHLKSSPSPMPSGGGGSLAGGAAGQPVPVIVEKPPEQPVETLARFLMPALHPLAVAGLVGIYAVFILLGREDLRNRAIRLFGAGDLHRSTAAIDDAVRRLSQYLLSQLALNTVAGIVVGIGLSVIGVPSPILWGVLFGCLRFVPYVGPPLAALAPIALAAAVAPGWSTAIWTTALFVVVEGLVGQVVEPLVYGHKTGLSPLAVVLAATFWTVLWGPIGLVLSTPMTVCLVVLGRHVEPLAFLDVMLGDQPALAPSQVFYQRMLADDPIETADEADRHLKERSLASYYDDVLLPAMLLAQEDVAQQRLDTDRQRRIAASAAEVVDNLSETEDDPEGEAQPAAVELMERMARRGSTEGGHASLAPVPLPERWTRRGAVRCIGARGPLDDAVAGALAQILARHGFGAEAVPHDMLAKARIRDLDLAGAGLVILSCLDGSSPAYLRFVLRRLHRRGDRVPVLIGAWWRGGDAGGPTTGAADAAQGRDAVATLAEAVAFATRLATSQAEVSGAPETGHRPGAAPGIPETASSASG